MFYRFGKNDVRMAIDLDGLFSDEECFIAGGAPSLKDFATKLNETRGVSVLAINNAATVVRPTLWVGGDRPVCYSKSILVDPTIMKFGIKVADKRRQEVNGRPWCEWPNTFFFGTKDGFNPKNFLNFDKDLVWWKNTFFIALQLAFRLGFRTAYLVGCGFDIPVEVDPDKDQYAWETHLDEDELRRNKRLYSNSVGLIESLLPHFKEKGFKLISCTPDSLANDILPYEEAETVLAGLVDRIPKPDTADLPHSSKSRSVEAAGP